VKKKANIPTFEEALASLEAIVAAMEKGDVPLEELVAKYAEASALLVRCRESLDKAALTIERLKAGAGAVETEPFAPENDGSAAAGD
jgi:exodeoxyribonuclease VII small subunit